METDFRNATHHIFISHKRKGRQKALEDVSFSVSEGEFIAIVGPSGCGKSTLLSIICGILKPEKRAYQNEWKNLKQSTTNIGYMLQHDHLFEWRTVYHNVLLGLEVQHMLSAKTRKKALELLEQYGLQQFKKFQTFSIVWRYASKGGTYKNIGSGTRITFAG